MNGTTEAVYGRIYLDSNVIIALVGGDADREVSRLLVEVVGSVRPSSRAPFATSELSLAECLVRALRMGLDAELLHIESVLTSGPWLEVREVSRDVLFSAALARSQYASIKLPDAIHVATAMSCGCATLLTADTGLKGEYQLVDNRWGQRGASHVVRIVRPDVPTLQSIVAWLNT
jgi:predicted nucleic acid-binding protein